MDEKIPILIIDGNPRTRKMLIDNLKEWNWHVAESAVEGLSHFESLKFGNNGLVIIDTDLPQANEVLKDMLSCEPSLMLILITPLERLDYLAGYLYSSMPEFIIKPMNPFTLQIALNRCRERIVLRQESLECRRIISEERFIAVRQLVEKMSAFISKLSKDAQGGIRFFNEMQYFISIHDRDCRVLALNPIYKEHLGDKSKCRSWEIYSSRWASQKTCPVGRSVDTGSVITTRAVVRYLSGARVPVIVHTAPIFDEKGDIALILEIFVGTREIDKMAEDIINTQQRYRQLFDAVPSYLVVLDRRLRISAINRRFKEVFGELIGKGFFDLYLTPTTHPSDCPICNTAQDGRPHHAEMILNDKEGVAHNVMAWTSPINTAAGKLIQVLVIFTDITEIRKLQDNLSTLGLMLGTVSHNLKGTLTGLDAGLYMIDSGFYRNMPARIEEGLDVSRLMAERIRRMVFDILYYAKERELEAEILDVRQFIEDIVANIEARIRSANIKLLCNFPPNAGKFQIDSGLMRSALINIFENAMDACIENPADHQHQISFTMKTDNDEVMFEIADNGIGMKEEQKKNLFNLFYSSKGRKGTGLGMFITKKVIEKHGGKISVDSEPEKGTKFFIRIPRKIMGITS